MLERLAHFKERMINHYSMTLLLVGCIIGLSAAWLGWGVIGVFGMGMVFSKTTAVPDIHKTSVFGAWPSQLFCHSQLRQTTSQGLENDLRQNQECVL